MKKHNAFAIATLGFLAVIALIIIADVSSSVIASFYDGLRASTEYVGETGRTSSNWYFSYFNQQFGILTNFFTPYYQSIFFINMNMFIMLPILGFALIVGLLSVLLFAKSEKIVGKIISLILNLGVYGVVSACFLVFLFEKELMSIESIVGVFQYSANLSLQGVTANNIDSLRINVITPNAIRIVVSFALSSLLVLPFITLVLSAVFSFIRKRVPAEQQQA